MGAVDDDLAQLQAFHGILCVILGEVGSHARLIAVAVRETRKSIYAVEEGIL